jgi:membrane protein
MSNNSSKFRRKSEVLLESSEELENAYYKFLKASIERLVDGFFIFKTRKAELLAGATTFFTLMSLSPMLLLVITVYGKTFGGLDAAYQNVMLAIKEGMPQLAPWIYESIQKIIKSQLSKDSLNWANIMLLLYTGAGLSGTLVFAMNNIADIKQRGGWVVETFKSILSAALVMSFISISIIFTFQLDLVLSLVKGHPTLVSLVEFSSKGLVQGVLFLSLLTFYFKFITAKKIRYSDGLFGAVTTMSCFFIAKSFYWVYIHYMRSDLQQSFGNFYTIIIAVLYIYFVTLSFFYGASVAYAPSYKRGSVTQKKELPETPPVELQDAS